MIRVREEWAETYHLTQDELLKALGIWAKPDDKLIIGSLGDAGFALTVRGADTQQIELEIADQRETLDSPLVDVPPVLEVIDGCASS